MVLEYSDGAKDKFLLISEPLRKCSGLKIDDDLEEDVSQIKLRARRKLTVAIGATSLFTVGYLLSVIGSVNTILLSSYSEEIHELRFHNMFMTTSFLGSVVGHVVFGYVSDIFGRELALKLSSVILVIFAILSSLSLADSLELRSSLILLSVMRFFLGIGIGGIMPAASVATFEAISMTMNPRTSSNNTSNSLYVLATTLIIDIGLLFSSFMPWLLVKVINVESARRLSAYCLAVGIIPLIFILSLVYLKWPGLFADSNTRGKDCTSDIRLSPSQITLQIDPTPCKNLTMKAILVTTIWFVYDLMIYPLNYYSSIIVSGEPISDVDKKDLKELLTISLIVSIFYVPGPLIAARMMLRMSPMSVLKTGLYLQVAASTAIFIYTLLSSTRYVPVISALFCFLLFSSELGLGSCIGIYANKSFPRNVRARMCAISSLVAKSGAFAGTLGFPHLNKLLTHDDSGLSSTFFAIILFLTIVMIVSLGRLNKLEKYDESIGRSSAAHRYRTGNL